MKKQVTAYIAHLTKDEMEIIHNLRYLNETHVDIIRRTIEGLVEGVAQEESSIHKNVFSINGKR